MLTTVAVTIAAYLLLLFAKVHGVFVWMSTILSCLGLSVTFASTILWISEHTTMTAGIAALRCWRAASAVWRILSLSGDSSSSRRCRWSNFPCSPACAKSTSTLPWMSSWDGQVNAYVAMDVFMGWTGKRRRQLPAMKLVQAEATTSVCCRHRFVSLTLKLVSFSIHVLQLWH